MNRQQRRAAGAEGWTPFEPAIAIPPTQKEIDAIAAHWGCTADQVQDAMTQTLLQDKLWKNNRYQVAVRRVLDAETNRGFPPMIHLSIKRLDREVIHDWRDLQRIKNELVGPEHEAVELYPAQSRLTDTANQYHLWVLADAGVRFPIGWETGAVSSAPQVGKSRQRPIEGISPSAVRFSAVEETNTP
jgi:hypothetical protein